MVPQARARARTAPTPYPRLAFHAIRCAQALSSLVVMAVMFYFIWNLVHEDFDPPRTFWILLAASLSTFFFLIGSMLVYACIGLSPRINMIGNLVLFLLWVPSFGYLWFFTRATLGHVCNRENWTGPVGIMVCRIYKALFAFAMLGSVTTVAALILDIVVWRRTTSRGKYAQMPDNREKPVGIGAPGRPYNAPAYSDSRSSIALEQYTAPNAAYGERADYALPEEQFSYDTSYGGAAAHHDPPAVAGSTPPTIK
ncbi:hypothetical protein BT63DRAFT_371566 [Microthyrium microscopicum]|uniref:MARVEL domain-containing protein n=1 Tax=Microthyrium microscopicum TaxID=703497 RepID=A0A6A6UEC1_9PEZI|nr:hypothetical protein BT63DRAFT_371566 [Microthyrium microscopicum]